MLACAGYIQAMSAIEVVIDTEIELVPVDVGAKPEDVFDTFRSPDPGVMPPVEAVMLSEVVW